LQAALFTGYFLLALWLIHRSGLHRGSGFNLKVWVAVFGLKVAACVINLYLYNRVFPNSDAAFFYWQSMAEIKSLPADPSDFFREWLLNWGDISGRLNFLQKENLPYWNNLGSLLQGKFMTLCNLLSFGHLYVNTVFYSLIFFFGQWLLYLRFYSLAPQRRLLILFGIFLLPSVLFWCSGIHKDGWVLTAFGLIAWGAPDADGAKSMRRILALCAGFLLLFVVRYFYAFCLLPAFFLWMFSRNKSHPLRIFLLGYGVLFLLFFSGTWWPDGFNPMNLIVHKQQEFMTLRGFSDIYLPVLEPHPLSFLKNLPYALWHVLWMPGFSLSHPLRYNLAGADALFTLLLLLLSALSLQREQRCQPFHLFAVFLSVSVYLFIGYTIPNSGALVRYKSEFTALLMPALFSMSAWPLLGPKITEWQDKFFPVDN
jgi:hypothetical protein